MNAYDIRDELSKRPESEFLEIEVCMPYEVARKVEPGADGQVLVKIVASFVRLAQEVVARAASTVRIGNVSEKIGAFTLSGDASALNRVVHDLEVEAGKRFLLQYGEIDYEHAEDWGHLGSVPEALGPTRVKRYAGVGGRFFQLRR
jgi:hypothetical protein